MNGIIEIRRERARAWCLIMPSAHEMRAVRSIRSGDDDDDDDVVRAYVCVCSRGTV